MPRTLPLRQRLLVLVVAAILPVAIVSALALQTIVAQQREQVERAALEIARALTTAVDGELDRSMAVIDALTAARALEEQNLRRFHATSRDVLAHNAGWLTVSLADPSGTLLTDARRDFGEPLGPVVESASFDTVVRTRAPTVGFLARGESDIYAVSLRVPVVHDGHLRYVRSALVKTDGFREVVARQQLAEDWVVSVFDAAGRRVARSRQHHEFQGTEASPTLQELMHARGDEGSGLTRALEGDEIYTAFVRSRKSGWTVAIGIPVAFIDAAVWRSHATYGTGLALSVVLGLLATLGIGRGIARPIDELRSAARALGRREAIVPPRTPIAEIRQVTDALQMAAAERARGEAEREALLAREQEARAAAESANRAKDEFLALLGHELRNPLGAIVNAVRLLEHSNIRADDAARSRGIIARQANHLARLTDDLLDAGRAIMGKIVLELRDVDLAAAAAQAVATLESSGRLGKHRVTQDLGTVWVRADPTRLEQIIANLLLNAITFTPAGGSVSITVGREGADAVLCVADTGIGIRPELLEQIFEPFKQGEPGLDRSGGGLGLGLTVVRKLAALHGGSARAESAGPGHGSTLTVRLPAIEAPRHAPYADVSASTPARDILIVEDNSDARETLRRLLELQGHRVRVAAEGTAALEAVRAAAPDVALVDIGLPGMDGYELARRIRAEAKRHVVLIALTGYGLLEDRRRSTEAGFDEHLVSLWTVTSSRERFGRRRIASRRPHDVTGHGAPAGVPPPPTWWLSPWRRRPACRRRPSPASTRCWR
jgi:signal transduction histidine kinase